MTSADLNEPGATLGAAVGGKGLKTGALGFLSSVVIGVASTAPAYSLAAGLGVVVAAVGFQSPAMMIIAFVPMLFIAAAYYYLNRADPDCGTTFSWVSKAMGPYFGWMGGWGILAADIIVMANLSQIAGLYTFQLFSATSYANSTNWVTVVGVLWIVVMTWICYIGIEVSARVQYVLLGAEVIVLAIFAVVALAKVYAGNVHGSVHPSLEWINPFGIHSTSALSAGLIGAIFIYWGWDSTVSVNEETEDSAHTPGRAAIASTIILVAIYVIVSIAAQAFQGPDFLVTNSADVLGAMGKQVLGSPFDKLLIIAVLTSASASTQTTILPTARTTLSMATHGAIPRVFSRVHPRYLTPSASTLTFGALSIVWYVVMTKVSANVLGASISALGLMIAFYYGLTGIACPIFYRRHILASAKSFVMICVAPLIGAAVLFFAFFKSAHDFYSDTTYGKLFGIGETFVIGIGFLVFGFVLMLISIPFFRDYFRRRPEIVDPEIAVHGAPSQGSA